ncbi:phage adaptor protein [Janthinobacterium sp. CG3]|uniref:phage adaptor protein n=1 Tax=Janthinobacterium sp. CG3 TaxID=1075768 RepID=UPI000363B084|nr:hypothetical protein [Janthinobacterium sp. CG3]
MEAAIEFCTYSGAWSETLDFVYMSNGTHSYDLELPKGSRALVISNVWTKSGSLVSKTMHEIAGLIPDWQTAQGQPVYYNQQNWDELRVYPTPNGTDLGTLTVRTSLAPTRAATTLPNFLVDRYLQTIAAGALYRLLIVPAQGWSNPQLAAYFKTEFNAGCAAAKVEIFHDRVAGSARVTPRRFGG